MRLAVTSHLSRGKKTRYDRGRMTVRITEAELARDVHAALEKVRQGVELVIEQDHRPVAVLKAPLVQGRRISEVIAALEASGANAVLDEDFAGDVEAGINASREPWNPPSWD
jgi:antitoxin (DNA-binding transcriptional repressor) of toxin-antitoxin stability system